MIDSTDAIVVSLVVALAAAVQGVAGFGFMVLAVSVLIQFFPAQLVVPALCLVYIPLGIAQTFQVRRDVDLGLLLTLAGAAVVGAVPGTLILKVADTVVIKRTIGVATLLVALTLYVKPGAPFRHDRAARIVSGVVAGIVGGITSAAGPPIILMGMKQRWSVRAFRATLFAFFLSMSVLLAALQYRFGLLISETVRFAVAGVPGVGIGFLVAWRLRNAVSDEAFRRIGIALLVLGGLTALIL